MVRSLFGKVFKKGIVGDFKTKEILGIIEDIHSFLGRNKDKKYL